MDFSQAYKINNKTPLGLVKNNEEYLKDISDNTKELIDRDKSDKRKEKSEKIENKKRVREERKERDLERKERFKLSGLVATSTSLISKPAGASAGALEKLGGLAGGKEFEEFNESIQTLTGTTLKDLPSAIAKIPKSISEKFGEIKEKLIPKREDKKDNRETRKEKQEKEKSRKEERKTREGVDKLVKHTKWEKRKTATERIMKILKPTLSKLAIATLAPVSVGLGITGSKIGKALARDPELEAMKQRLKKFRQTKELKYAHPLIKEATEKEAKELGISAEELWQKKRRKKAKAVITTLPSQHIPGKQVAPGVSHQYPGVDIRWTQAKAGRFIETTKKEKRVRATKQSRLVSRFLHHGEYTLYKGKHPAVKYQNPGSSEIFYEVHYHTFPNADLRKGDFVAAGDISGFLMTEKEMGGKYKPHQDIKFFSATKKGTLSKILSVAGHVEQFETSSEIKRLIKSGEVKIKPTEIPVPKVSRKPVITKQSKKLIEEQEMKELQQMKLFSSEKEREKGDIVPIINNPDHSIHNYYYNNTNMGEGIPLVGS